MKLDPFIFQVALLFLPGMIWARLDASWAQSTKPSEVEFFVRAFLFGLTSYAAAFLIYSVFGVRFEVIELDRPALINRAVALQVISTSVVGLSLGILWLYAVNRKWIARLLQNIGATKRFGDEDVWDFTFNSTNPAVQFVHLRDFEQKATYAGYVDAFSEGGEVRELVLRQVVVYDFDGNEMYQVPRLYLARKRESIHIEFPTPS